MSYYQFQDEDGNEYGSYETFYADQAQIDEWRKNSLESEDLTAEEAAETWEPGWYWWSCFPGCLPESDWPNGPFESEDDAIADATNGY